MTIEPIAQEEETGCGLACVAMLAEKSYEQVRQDAANSGIFAADQRLWSETGYVRALLAGYGVTVAETEIPFSTWSALPPLALLAIKHNIEAGKACWHWVVYRRINGKPAVLDPAANLPNHERDDFDNMDPKWFIEVILDKES